MKKHPILRKPEFLDILFGKTKKAFASKVALTGAWDILMLGLEHMVIRNHGFRLGNLGTFEVQSHPEVTKTRRNPFSGESFEHTAPAHRRLVFKTAAAYKKLAK